MFEKKIEKTLKLFWKLVFLGKNALNRGLALLIAVWKLNYTGDGTNWNRTNRGVPEIVKKNPYTGHCNKSVYLKSNKQNK